MVEESGHVEGQIIYEGPLEIGGETVTSYIPKHYLGKMSIMDDNGTKVIAVMPTVEEGLRVAKYATSPDGGYGSVSIFAAGEERITHATFMDWLEP